MECAIQREYWLGSLEYSGRTQQRLPTWEPMAQQLRGSDRLGKSWCPVFLSCLKMEVQGLLKMYIFYTEDSTLYFMSLLRYGWLGRQWNLFLEGVPSLFHAYLIITLNNKNFLKGLARVSVTSLREWHKCSDLWQVQFLLLQSCIMLRWLVMWPPWIHMVSGVLGSHHGARWRKEPHTSVLKEKNKFVPRWFFHLFCFVGPPFKKENKTKSQDNVYVCRYLWIMALCMQERIRCHLLSLRSKWLHTPQDAWLHRKQKCFIYGE